MISTFERQCCGGLNFGYFYEGSPIIAYDGEPHPAYTMRDFTSSTVPGCRAPHLWLGDGRSLYDALGPGYTLIRLDPTVRRLGHWSMLPRSEASRSLSSTLMGPKRRALYARKLVLVRPDQHVAWRGDGEPSAPLDLIDLVRGARSVPARKAHSMTSSALARRVPPTEQETPPPTPSLQSRG